VLHRSVAARDVGNEDVPGLTTGTQQTSRLWRLVSNGFVPTHETEGRPSFCASFSTLTECRELTNESGRKVCHQPCVAQALQDRYHMCPEMMPLIEGVEVTGVAGGGALPAQLAGTSRVDPTPASQPMLVIVLGGGAG
jgi:hypothetical protein